jgi:hypothetical protein
MGTAKRNSSKQVYRAGAFAIPCRSADRVQEPLEDDNWQIDISQEKGTVELFFES